jgi:hypothetical protein
VKPRGSVWCGASAKAGQSIFIHPKSIRTFCARETTKIKFVAQEKLSNGNELLQSPDFAQQDRSECRKEAQSAQNNFPFSPSVLFRVRRFESTHRLGGNADH